MTDRTRIRVTIDRLAFQGLTPVEAAKARRALATELETQLAGAGHPPGAPRDVGRTSLRVGPSRGGADLGRATARAIAGRFGGGPQGAKR